MPRLEKPSPERGSPIGGNVDFGTKTHSDAFRRIALARIGSLAGEPTEEYLVALRAELYDWIVAVDRVVARPAPIDPNPCVDTSYLNR